MGCKLFGSLRKITWQSLVKAELHMPPAQLFLNADSGGAATLVHGEAGSRMCMSCLVRKSRKERGDNLNDYQQEDEQVNWCYQ